MRKIFRLSLIIIFCYCMLVAEGYADTELPFPDSQPLISMDFQDANLKDVLKILSIQSGLNFIATEALQERKITLYLDKVPLKETMDKLFKANNLSYELDRDSNIFLVKDWGKPEIERITKIFFLKYATVSSSALTKQKQRDTSTGGITTASSAPTAAQGEETGITLVVKRLLSEHGSLVEDPRTNSFIITDIPSRMPLIERTIAALDVPTPLVMLEVEMLDVSKNTVDKLGFEFGENPFTLILPGGKGTKFNIVGAESVGSTSVRNTFGQTGALTLGKTYASLLDYLRTQTDTKYLARPRILILNNETAEISIAKDEIVGFNETVECTTTGTTTTREYIRSTDLKLTPEGTGIILRVTPQINPLTNEITMVINPKSSVTSSSTIASNQADAEVRGTKSIVKVRDSETIILGGLLHQDKNLTVKKLPLLSNIPFIGALFRHKNLTKDIERELLVFITPHIIKDINNIEVAQARKLVIPAREQNVVSGVSRQFSINTLLDTFEKK